MTSIELRHDVVILACAISAGIHGALVPAHLAEGTGAGVGFLVATVALGAIAVARPSDREAWPRGSAPRRSSQDSSSPRLRDHVGLPVLHPEPEAVDGLALVTKAIEAVGLLAATSLVPRPSTALTNPHPKGT